MSLWVSAALLLFKGMTLGTGFLGGEKMGFVVSTVVICLNSIFFAVHDVCSIIRYSVASYIRP